MKSTDKLPIEETRIIRYQPIYMACIAIPEEVLKAKESAEKILGV